MKIVRDGIKFLRCNTIVVSFDFEIGIVSQDAFSGDHRLGLSHMLLPKQKLSVEVTNIDCIQIDLEQKQLGNRKEVRYAGLLTISMSLKPESAKFLRTSQPMPPAPTTSTLEVSTNFFTSLGRTAGTADTTILFQKRLASVTACFMFNYKFVLRFFNEKAERLQGLEVGEKARKNA